ncbi:MAG TPA: glycosyltransferase family 39 protein [Burkholderiales bacterium]|nr:glycosyltransferase family 39 protein [Burkholderiales bacterium]
MSAKAGRLLALLAAAIFLAVWFSGLEYRKLAKTDEGRYAEIPREMVVTGDWLTPRLNGIKYFEKPPLQYWGTALAYEAFGVRQWTSRLWPAFTGLLGILAAWLGARRLYGEPAGRIAAMVCASMLLYEAMAHIDTLDMGLAGFMAWALSGFLCAQTAGSERAVSGWMALSWFATALAVLSKGLVAILLPGLTLALYSLLLREFSFWRRLRPLLGVLILALVAVPWFVAVSIANPEFPQFFFIHEHFTRFLTKVHRRVQPWWFFFPILLAGMLPWTISAVPAALRAWREKTGGQGFRPGPFLLVYCAVVFAFFSASGSKLPSYILPLFPAAAILIGAYLPQVAPRHFAWQIAPAAVLGLVMLVAAPLLAPSFRNADAPLEMYLRFARWQQAGGAFLLAGAAAAWLLCARKRLVAAAAATAMSALVGFQVVTAGYDELHPLASSWQIASQVKPLLQPDTPFYSVRIYEQALPFYLERPVTLVAYGDEFEYGLKQEPWRAIDSLPPFEQRWREAPVAFALMQRGLYEKLRADGLPMSIVASDPKRVIVRNK